MKWFVFLTLLALVLFRFSDPFDPHNLYTEIPKGSEEIGEIVPHLDQTYTYFAKGAQMVAFLSEDGQTVLKIFKAEHRRSFKLSRLFEKKDWAASKQKWSIKFQDTCRRYKMAYADLKEETGLLGLHFTHTKTPLLVTLKSHKSYRIDLSKHPFILQQKATLAPTFAKKHPQEAKQALRALLTSRLAKGYSDPGQDFKVNYGFLDGKAVQIDVGKIEKFEGDEQEELEKIYNRIDAWISKDI